MIARLLSLAALAATGLSASSGADYDLVIRHGRVVDGTGNPAFFADVAVKDGRIAVMGRVDGAGREEIDATGLMVAPGFIDVHTHADDVAEHPLAENFIRMGVTTLVAGNCGGSALDVADALRTIEKTRVAVNFATLIGHNTVRRAAMSRPYDREPTDEELSRMQALVRQGMDDGAVGLSTGLIYQPGTFSGTDEIIALAREAAAQDGIYVTHMRDEGRIIFEALEETFRIAREANVRTEISHLKLSGPVAWGQAEQVLAAIERARDEGLDITQDQYAYTASSTGLSQLIPSWAVEGGRDGFARRLADPDQKQHMLADMRDTLTRSGRSNYTYAVIASFRADPSLNGLTVVEAARRVRGGDSLEDQMELVLDIQRRGGASGVFHGMQENDLQAFMRHPHTMVACDSGIREHGKGVPHPRGYGNAPRVLGRYVRELKVLRLEDAIRRMTSYPATTFRFKDRGLVREQAWADLVLFDPADVLDRATFSEPHQYPVGIPHVLVNGVLVVKNGEATGARPGRVLRHNEVTALSSHR